MYSNSFYDPFGFQSPYDRRRQQEIARRQTLMEEERRRNAEHERRRRIEEKLALEEQHHRRQQEIARRQKFIEQDRKRKAEHERRRRVEEQQRLALEEQQRLALEDQQRICKMKMMERERAHKMERMGRQQRHSKDQSSDLAPGTIVRGADGNLYRVVAPPRDDRYGSNGSFSGTNSDSDHNLSAKNEVTNRSQKCQDSEDLSINSQMNTSLGKNCMNEDTQSKVESVSSIQEHEPLQEVIVENVPDDEDDELRDMRSVWRNRVPSLGEWMEPVESF